MSQNDPQPILVKRNQGPSPTTNNHKRLVSNTRITSFPSTSSDHAPTRFLRWPHYVGTSISPRHLSLNGNFRPYTSLYRSTFNLYTYLYILLILSILPHHLFDLLQGRRPCRYKLFLIHFILALFEYLRIKSPPRLHAPLYLFSHINI